MRKANSPLMIEEREPALEQLGMLILSIFVRMSPGR